MQVGRWIWLYSLVFFIFFSGIKVDSKVKHPETLLIQRYYFDTNSYSPIISSKLSSKEYQFYKRTYEIQRIVDEESCYIGIMTEYGFIKIINDPSKLCVVVFYQPNFQSKNWERYLKNRKNRFFVDLDLNLIGILDDGGFSKKFLALQLLAKMENYRALVCDLQDSNSCSTNSRTSGMLVTISYLSYMEDKFKSNYTFQVYLVQKNYDKYFYQGIAPHFNSQMLSISINELNKILGPSLSSKENYLRLQFVHQHALLYIAFKHKFSFSESYDWVF